jgi:two-component system, OmpR family, KDP operon response regulator KdpE
MIAVSSPPVSDVTTFKPTVLVVDDELQIRRLLRVSLGANGYRVLEAVNGQEGIDEAAQHRPDVVVLDLGLPDMDGMTVLKRLREWSQVPIVMLSVRDREDDKIVALDNGADDYVTKPFATGELLARLRAAMRHGQSPSDSAIFHSGHLEVDLAARTVKVSGTDVKLTATEYALLRLFVRHAGRVVMHQQILREVWGPNYIDQTQYLRVFVAHLREKIEAEPSNPSLLLTEPGIGYRLMELEPEPKGN